MRQYEPAVFEQEYVLEDGLPSIVWRNPRGAPGAWERWWQIQSPTPAHALYFRGVTRFAKTPGCALSGFVLVKKVPGTLHFLAKSPGHSFDHETINMTHTVNYMYFGNKPSPRRRKV